MSAELERVRVESEDQQITFGTDVARSIQDGIDAWAIADLTRNLSRPTWKTEWQYQDYLASQASKFEARKNNVALFLGADLELEVTDSVSQQSRAQGLLVDVDYPARSLILEHEGETLDPLVFTQGDYRDGQTGYASYRGEHLLLTLKVLSFAEGFSGFDRQ